MGLFDRWKKDSKHEPESVPAPRAPVESVLDYRIEVTGLDEEVVPIEERIAHSQPDTFGLYPHEILALDYAPKFTMTGQRFQGFWEYNYGVKSVSQVLKSLISRGFLTESTRADTVTQQTAASLKRVLAARGLSTTGAKATLVARALADVPFADLEKAFPQRYYALTGSGHAALDASPFIPYIHRHPTMEYLDIFELTKMVQANPSVPWRDLVWRHLNEQSVKHGAAGDWGLYRNARRSMSVFAAEEGRWRDAITLMAEVNYWDLSGTSNGFRMEYLGIYADSFFPYPESTARIAPANVTEIVKWATTECLADDALRGLMAQGLAEVSAPFHLFTKDEVIDAFFLTRDQNAHGLIALFETAEKRFKAAYPTLKRFR
ncbi:SAP domain-containing protein [Humibacter ginsengisoli]